MRLIDADELLQKVGNIKVTDDIYYSISQIYEIIKNQPTAYDVEKVVDVVREDCYSMGFDESQAEIIVNDIVKRGGIE